MNGTAALCIDRDTRCAPESIGLEGETLDAQQWLYVFSSGEQARKEISSLRSIDTVWVVSSDDVDPINLAATLKRDHPELPVYMVEFDGGGSLLSRAHTALIDDVLGKAAFVKSYTETKTRLAEKYEAPVDSAFGEYAQAPAHMKSTVAPQASVALKTAFLMPVVSGSGGAGKSTISVLSALAAQQLGYHTLLFDCDFQFGDVHRMLGVSDPLHAEDVASQPELLEELGTKPELSLVAAPRYLDAAEKVVLSLPDVLAQAGNLFDVVIVNTGATWAEQHAILIERSSTTLFLIDQRASSIWACKRALKLCTRCGIATGPIRFALNKCTKNSPFTSIDVSCGLQGAEVFELRDGGRAVEDYLGGGSARELTGIKNDLVESVENLVARLLPNVPGRSKAQGAQHSAKPEQKRKGLVFRGRRKSDR